MDPLLVFGLKGCVTIQASGGNPPLQRIVLGSIMQSPHPQVFMDDARSQVPDISAIIRFFTAMTRAYTLAVDGEGALCAETCQAILDTYWTG